jgi:hypothetical protein
MSETIIPRRTHQTELDDDALLIFDALFDRDRTLHELRREQYAEAVGVSYTHNVQLLQLEKFLADLVALGYMVRHPDDESGGQRYGLTEEGGRLWELERAPVWESYVRDDTVNGDTGRDVWVVVKSPSLDVAQNFLEAAVHAGIHSIDPMSWQEIATEGELLLPWKAFPTVYTVQGMCASIQGRLSWEVYEEQRFWWRTIAELATLPR